MSKPKVLVQKYINQAYRQLLDNASITINPPVLLPPPEETQVSATVARMREENAKRSMAALSKRGSLLPEIWSTKLLSEFAKDSIMGDFLKPDIVGPDWPQYAGVGENLARRDGRTTRRPDVADSLLYGTSVTRYTTPQIMGIDVVKS